MKEIMCKSIKELWNWLDKHQSQKESVWLVHYKFASGKSDITRHNLVDTLLCFGWIDSVPGKVDEMRTKIRISPRNPKSAWSKINVDKVERLIKEKKMQPRGLEVIEIAKKNGRFSNPYEGQSAMKVPGDFLKLLHKRENAVALAFFKTFNKTNQYATAYRLHVVLDRQKRATKMLAFIDQFKKKKYFHAQS